MTLKKYLCSIKFEILIFTYLLFQLYLKIPSADNMHTWCTTPYALSYEMGFNSRFLIGSFVNILTKYITMEYLHTFILICLILLSLLVAVLLGNVIKKSDNKTNTIMIVLVLLFLASPASISFLFYRGNFGRLDTFLLLFTLIALILLDKPRLKFFIPVLCFMSMATQQVFTFTYMPIIVLLMLLDLAVKEFSKKQVVFTAITFVVLIVSFVYFQFFAPVLDYSNPQIVADLVLRKTNIPVNVKMIDFEYYKTISDHWYEFVIVEWELRVQKGIMVCLLMMPLIVIFISLWRSAIKNCSSKIQKFILSLMMLAPIASIPAFVLTIDWGRWFAAVFITQFALILYLARKEYKPILLSLNKMQEFMNKHLFIFIFIVLYLSCLGTFNAAEPLDMATRLLNSIKEIF